MMSKIALLFLIESFQAMVSLSSSSDPILSHIVEDTKGRDTQYKDLCSKIDGMTNWVARRITKKICPSAKN
jgi:hypothetical protein